MWLVKRCSLTVECSESIVKRRLQVGMTLEIKDRLKSLKDEYCWWSIVVLLPLLDIWLRQLNKEEACGIIDSEETEREIKNLLK